jgi:hypothetical protein
VSPSTKPGTKGEAHAGYPHFTPVEPLRSGQAWLDPEDGLNYRVVDVGILRADQGWGTSDFWVKSYLKTEWRIFRGLVLRGIFDAAIDVEGQRRYRLLDPARVQAQMKEIENDIRGRRRGA